MKLLILAFLFLSLVSFASPTMSAAPAGQKVHKEIKAGQVIVPAPVKPAVVMSADKSKAKK